MSKTKFSPDEVVVAVTSFAASTPHPHTVVRRGSRWRGDHPVVRTWPEAFVEDGVPESEWPRAAPVEAPASEPEFHKPRPPIPAGEEVICTLAFGSLTRWVKVGERFHIEDELVQKFPQHFAKLTPLTD